MTMAKLTLTFLLFFVVSSSHARDLTDRSEYASIPDSVADSDSKASIFLPSEKLSEYESPKSIAETNQVRTESNPTEINTVDATESVSDPLVMITFRPINRQFGRSVPLMFRRGRRGCHHRHSLKPWRLIDRVGEIPYGNDMIVPDERSHPNSGANWGSNREMVIPSKWSEFRHVGQPWESYRIDWKEEGKHHHHHHLHHHHEEDREEAEEHKEKSGFLRKFRKFLKQLEF
ncbi:unnamed protein product [Citrullus colocynthis]|uniref:Uncharacterized protein n=1 Tax=Citrullus colocynthis TaxID=252529 RepID=A0ABP0YWA7_9ROSI